jgi:hypothetical protein
MKHLHQIGIAVLFLVSTVCATNQTLNDTDQGSDLDDTNAVSRRPAPDEYGRVRCGGHVPADRYYSCSTDEVCIDDPYRGGCGMACDTPGICVSKRKRCGGFAGFKCDGKCVDDPTDNCDPKRGGADCIGVCVAPPNKPIGSMVK